MEFQLQEDGPFILDMSGDGFISLVVQDTSRKLSYIDKKLYEVFPSDKLTAVTSVFDEKGLEQFSKLMSPYISDKDIPAQISLKRLARTSNSIMVLDDDVMVVKQLEHILSGFGHVTVLQDHKEFADTYIQYAPDVLFLDIHLRDGAHGPDVMDMLLHEVDPYAYVIVISSDTAAETVQDIKDKGIKGFAVKPFDRTKLLKCVMGAPTFKPRNT